MGNQTRTIAVVLAGAVAKGAFEAGVIQALVRSDVKIARIVAASSGALNGTVLASSVRTRDLVRGADALADLWRDHAQWTEVFHASVRDLLKRDGVSDQKHLLALLHDHIQPTQPDQPDDVNLRIIVAALDGCRGAIGAEDATTFESVCDFDTTAFGSRDGLDRVFAAATASAAFPIVFAPVEIAGVGPCVDGGTVNNTPMKWALDGDIGAQVDAIVVVATSVAVRTEAPDLTGVGLIGHLADMLIEERLYRDLREAEQVNDGLAKLEALVGRGVLTGPQLDRVKAAIGWGRRRPVQVIQVRPTTALRGTAFSGFFDAGLRSEHLDAGFRRGLEVLGARGWPLRPSGRPASVRDDDVVGVAADAVVLPVAIERDRAEQVDRRSPTTISAFAERAERAAADREQHDQEHHVVEAEPVAELDPAASSGRAATAARRRATVIHSARWSGCLSRGHSSEQQQRRREPQREAVAADLDPRRAAEQLGQQRERDGEVARRGSGSSRGPNCSICACWRTSR